MLGTALAGRMAREGRLLPGRGAEFATLVDVIHQPSLMSVAELAEALPDGDPLRLHFAEHKRTLLAEEQKQKQ